MNLSLDFVEMLSSRAGRCIEYSQYICNDFAGDTVFYLAVKFPRGRVIRVVS